MAEKTKKRTKIKYIKPPNILKMKVGSGGIPKEKIAQAQSAIATFRADFRPDAKKFIAQLSAAREKLEKNPKQAKKGEGTPDEILKPVMQIKANGGMFQYQLVSDVADICLQFLESVDEYDQEAAEIIKAYEKTMQTIIENNLKGDGGTEGYDLVMELHRACKRYFKKHSTKSKKTA